MIELMIIVIIIGILAAIALPNFIGVQDKARAASVKANMRTTQIAAESFATDNIPQSSDAGAPLYDTAPSPSASRKPDNVPSAMFKTPNFVSYFQQSVTNNVMAISITIKPVDTAGQSITRLSLDTNSSRGRLSANPPYASDLNLNQTGNFASDWKCASNGTVFSCQGKTPLAAGKETVLVMYFNEVLPPPPFLSVQIGTINVGVELKR